HVDRFAGDDPEPFAVGEAVAAEQALVARLGRGGDKDRIAQRGALRRVEDSRELRARVLSGPGHDVPYCRRIRPATPTAIRLTRRGGRPDPGAGKRPPRRTTARRPPSAPSPS